MPETSAKGISGCIRMLNADVIDLYARVNVGTKIVVLPNHKYIATIVTSAASARSATPQNSVFRLSSIY